jgi:hypothetical protein
MDYSNITPFSTIYDSFLSRVTSEMYMEMSELDTLEQLQGLLLNAIPRFKMPKFDIFDYEEGYFDSVGFYTGVESDGEEVPATMWVGGFFRSKLTAEEINILSLAMVIEWFGQQLATTEYTKMKYSGSDFKFTSQANHMAKLKVMIDAAIAQCKSLQDTYKRRKRTDAGEILSTLGQVMETPEYGYKIRS